MTSRLFSAWGLLGLAVMGGGQVLAADASLCVSIADPAARLVCYDAALKPPAGMPAAPTQRSATAAPAAPVAAVSGAAPVVAPAAPAKDSRLLSMFGLQPKADRSAAARPSLQAKVVDVKMRPSGQVITLDNEQVWQITEILPDAFVKASDAVVIESGSLGSFLMSRAGGGGLVRVKRLR